MSPGVLSDAALPPEPGAIACPRCASPIGRDQDWCLVCGAAARTRLAPAPNWKLPIAVLASVVALSLVALVIAFAALTDDPGPATGATGASGPTVIAPPPAPAPAPAPAPVAPAGPTVPSGATGATPPPPGPTGANGPKKAAGRNGAARRRGATGRSGAKSRSGTTGRSGAKSRRGATGRSGRAGTAR